MLNKIIKFSLDHKLLILLAAILLIVAGLWSANRTDIDVFPDLTAPQVVVMTDAVGMAPEEVERLVTFPIETAVNGATNVRRVRSTSLQGCSFVFVEFDWGMDVFRARQIVSEKLTTLTEQLPEGITPVLAPQSSVMGEILFVSLQLDTAATNPVTSMMELRTLAEWVVKPAILGTGGVSQVTIIGGDYAVYSSSITYYDGTLKGVTDTYTKPQDVLAIADNSSIHTTSETIDGETYIVRYLETAREIAVNVDTDVRYTVLNTALSSAGTGETVKLLEDITTYEDVTVPANIEVTLD